MTRLLRPIRLALLAVTTLVLVWVLFVGLPKWTGEVSPGSGGRASASQAAGQKIKVNLFYVAEDGTKLAAVEQEVGLGADAVEQARSIIQAQLAAAAPPLVSAIPPGTTLRALFVTAAGDAYVDLSRELVDAHPGGSTNELLTIYTLVDALTANLPAVRAVQILVEGRELDTLAGHVDLRRPLARRLP
jgi:spore germination protein GerM